MLEATAVSAGDALACAHCAPMQPLDPIAPAALPAEQESPGATINDKPVRDLDWIFDNFFRPAWRDNETRWDDGEEPTTYSIPTTLPDDYRNWLGDPVDEGVNFSTLSEAQADTAHLAMDILDSVIALDFTFLGTNWNAGLRIMNTVRDTGSAHATPPYYNSQREQWGDIWIHTNNSTNFDMVVNGEFRPIGSAALVTLMHEIGHAMGLQHPGNYDASDSEPADYGEDANYFQDSMQYTIMSYFGASATEPTGPLGLRPNTYLLHDVYALQREYGAEMTTRTGDTTYGYYSNAGAIFDLSVNSAPRYVIWDAGGFDTINLELATEAVEIDLRPGAFSSYGGGLNNIAIAYDFFATNPWDAWIEAARGGSGNDTLRGNDGDNFLYGGDGNDRAYGSDGTDALYGEDGNDRLEGGDMTDLLYGGEGSDTLLGQDGDDLLNGNDDHDRLLGGEGADTLNGGDGNDTLDGGFGLDVMNGGAGFDRVSYLYSSEDWTINLAAGTAGFGAGDETLSNVEGVWTGAGNDTVTLAANGNWVQTGAGDDLIIHAEGGNTVDGGTGFDRYSYAPATDGVRVDLRLIGNQKVLDRPGDDNDRFDRIANIERLEGSGFGDTLTAAHAANRLEGEGGSDILRAIGTGDTLLGGNAADTLIAGAGNDLLAGGDGFDMLSLEYATGGVNAALADGSYALAGLGTDAWSSIEALRGSAYADTLTGSDADNRIEGGNGHDRILARGGADTVLGGNGNDWINADNDNALAQGDDLAFGGIGADTILGGFGDDTLHGEDHNDSLAGGAGHNDLFGGDGADTMSAGTGNDRFEGGDGVDFVDYRAIAGAVVINLDQVIQNPAGAGLDELIGIEGLLGTAQGDILWGVSTGANRLYGMDGNDELRGGTGADYLVGGNGNDTIRGLGGGDTISGGAGRDLARFDDASASLMINLEIATDQQTGGAGILRISTVDDLIGGDFHDTLAGNSSANDLRGGLGDDRLFGRDGHDRLWGGEGADTLDGGAGNDSLYGEGGVDTASYETATSGVAVDLGLVVAQFTWGSGWDLLSSIANLTGSTHGDVLRGNTSANLISDLGGDDWVQADGGNDTVLAGGGGADTYEGGSGADLISYADQTMSVILNLDAGTASGLGLFFDDVLDFEYAITGSGADTITGNAGNNRLESGAGNDSLVGGAGGDTLIGGAGSDRLFGGTGADRFVFGNLEGTDRVQDFEQGVDRLRFLHAESFADLVFGAFGTVSFGGTTVQLTGVNTALLTEADFIFG